MSSPILTSAGSRASRCAFLGRIASLVVLAAAVPGCAWTRSGTQPDALPVTRVILYQNGVGYFERQGRIDGDTLVLHCRQSQINDILKSLTVIDRGSGRAVSVSLPLERSGAKMLSELPKQVRGASGLLDVLRVFRGARVRVHGSQGTVVGRALGVEEDVIDPPFSGAPWERTPPRKGWRLTVKNERGHLVVYPVNAIRRLVLLDRALEVGLDKSLDVSLEEGTWKPITLSVRLAGARAHDLLVSYIVEMPMWKPAYRLVLQPERPPLLQGWAVVDNVSGEAWTDVQLSMVAGTPMSFTYDLHSPRFTQRLNLTPANSTAMAPTREQAGYAAPAGAAPPISPKDMLQRGYARHRAAGQVATEQRRAQDLYDQGAISGSELNMVLEKQVRTNVQGQDVGSLFRYDLKDRVTVPDSSSTLVSIINARVPGAEVLLFRPELTSGYAASHPYRAVRFTNESGFSLEKGPVAIYSAGTFVGEGFLERMEKKTTIFLTYAIDGQVTMSENREAVSTGIRLLRIRSGMIETEAVSIDRRSYVVKNQHERALTAYVKSLRQPGHQLKDRPAGTVDTPDASYVPVKVPARGEAKLAIEWSSPVRRWIGVDTAMATNVLKLYIGGGQVPAHVRPVLEKILVIKDKLEQLGIERDRAARLKAELSADQNRVRANLDLLRKVRGNAALRNSVTRSLARLEEELSKLTARFVKLDEEKAQLDGQIRVLIGQITLEGR